MKNTILITGSSRGIGAAIARLAKKYGYEVLLHGRTESKELMSLAKELKSDYLIFDITKEIEIQKALSNITTINSLVNSAGINISKSFDELTNMDWKDIYDVNLFGLVNVTKNVLPLMDNFESIGKIVNISSIKGLYSSVGRVAYASSKAAVINLTTGLAKELAPKILVNAVAPGFVKTQMTSDTMSERIKKQLENILLKRTADPSEIADVVLFLISDKNRYITGQTINVDGGFSIKND
jgi:3-oxoacyl-[acyl-carrier protein] reductase